MKKRSTVEMFSACVYLLTRGPRTCGEIEDLLGMERSVVMNYLEALMDEGVVRQEGQRKTEGSRRAAQQYVWGEP